MPDTQHGPRIVCRECGAALPTRKGKPLRVDEDDIDVDPVMDRAKNQGTDRYAD